MVSFKLLSDAINSSIAAVYASILTLDYIAASNILKLFYKFWNVLLISAICWL